MRKYPPRFVLVWAGNFSGMVTACSVRAKHQIADGHPLADGPEHAAGKAGGNLGFPGMGLLIYGDKRRVELTPAIGKLSGQVALYAIIRANEAFRKALLRIAASFPEHKTIVFHKSKLRMPSLEKWRCALRGKYSFADGSVSVND